MSPLKISIRGVDVVVTAQPLSSHAFAPFGEVIQNPRPDVHPSGFADAGPLPLDAVSANQGSAIKYQHVTRMVNRYDKAPSGKPGVAVMNMFVCAARALKKTQQPSRSPSAGGTGGTSGSRVFEVKILERHPFTTQTFSPLSTSGSRDPSSKEGYLVIVAPKLGERPSAPPPPPSSSPGQTTPATATVDPGTSAAPGTQYAGPGHDQPDHTQLKAFIATTDQAVTYGAGIWHAPMVALGPEGSTVDFVVTQFANGVGIEDYYPHWYTPALCEPALKIPVNERALAIAGGNPRQTNKTIFSRKISDCLDCTEDMEKNVQKIEHAGVAMAERYKMAIDNLCTSDTLTMLGVHEWAKLINVGRVIPESTDAKNKLEDLSGVKFQPGENPYKALIEACHDDAAEIQSLYSTHRVTRNSQQKEKFLSSEFKEVIIDPFLLRLEKPEIEPGFTDPRNCLVFWARPPEHILKLASHLQSLLKQAAPSTRTPSEITPLVEQLRPALPALTSYTFTHRSRLVKPMLSYDLAAIAVSFLPAAGEPVTSPPPSSTAASISQANNSNSNNTAATHEVNDSYSYHHLRRDAFDMVKAAGVEVASRYVVPSAHITLGRYLGQEDHATPEMRERWTRTIDEVNAWLEGQVWDVADGAFVGEWIVGQEKGIDARDGCLWYGGGRTVMMGEGF
ncbi:hypothetical protein VMCG_09125 [Cytospora schulzeri]|uniref:Ureidoglycolate hydrolase n=1 Tax=Cytospora schulzeri TaxID=448051 RepID=A0A423VMY3_9PEZI|nr:hypothetical protein VMCG_09125 [Valsa malicola]